MASPFVLFAGERLSSAELTAACLDGDLVALGEGYIPADAAETVWMRAVSLRPLLRDTLAATRLSAAWIRGVAPEPSRHEVQRAVHRRIHDVRDRRVLYRDGEVPAVDLELFGGVRVTTVARTVADLARSSDPSHERALRAWLDADPAVAAPGLAWVRAHPRHPGRSRAMAVLSATTT